MTLLRVVDASVMTTTGLIVLEIGCLLLVVAVLLVESVGVSVTRLDNVVLKELAVL